jgi:YfiH family protein
MDKEIIIPDIFLRQKVTAFFTTKTFNADYILNAIPAAETFYMPVQKHTDKVLVVEHDFEPKIADAVITDRQGLAIGVQTADCVPLLLFDPVRRVAGAVHAGWRGTAHGILINAIETFTEQFRSEPENIMIAIGPCIKGVCYEVGAEVVDAVTKTTGRGNYVSNQGGRQCIDLAGANKLQAISRGILPDNIWTSADCTHCMPGKYFSYRYSKGAEGRQYAFIALTGN